MKVINLFGGPGIGKSGIAAGVFAKMKAAALNVEFAAEVAKDLVWEERYNVLRQDQILIFAKQHRRLIRLVDQVDYVVTDCPLLMGVTYIPEGYYKSFEPLNVEAALSFDNINILLSRMDGTHTNVGRYHTEDQAKEKDVEIRALLNRYDPTYTVVPVNEHTVDTLYCLLTTQLLK